ncbi:MAG: glycosyltransferase family 39 protein [Ignavibacteria bacterium]|nr:glycosyltransferase family 39 protein [Ignavibacteria bacterium]
MLKPGYFQHPGIAPQLIMAVVIKISHMLQGNDPNIVLDTFSRPEFYLQRINVVFTIINVISLYYLGKVTYKKTGSIFAALFLQFTPFISVMVIYELTLNIPETFLLSLILILLTITVSFLYEENLSNKINLFYMFLFGITCGLALASKISVLPIMILPFLIIKKFVNKTYFVVIALVTFLILFFLISPDSTRIWKFVFTSMVHSGKYGTGSANFMDTSQIIPRLTILSNEFFLFSVIYVLIFITLLLQFIPKFKNQVRTNKYFLSLNGVFIIMSFFILLVIKQVESYYIYPGLLFSVFGIFCVNSVVADLIPGIFRFSRLIYLYIFFILFSIPQYESFKSYKNFFDTRKQESNKILDFLEENYSKSIIISSDQTASLPTAFYSGLNYTGSQTTRYNNILMQKFPDYIYFERWRADFNYLRFDEDLERRLLAAETVVFHAFNEANFNEFKERIIELTNKKNTTYSEVFSNKNGEKIYLVSLKE